MSWKINEGKDRHIGVILRKRNLRRSKPMHIIKSSRIIKKYWKEIRINRKQKKWK